MIKQFFTTLVLSSLYVTSIAQGVQFEQGSSWEQVKAKAKAEHKYLLVDCYATWCGPCKKMDADVYTDAALGKFINDMYVSVKAQMDTSANDDAAIKSWYADAHTLATTYKVNAYPAFLFFTPDGKLAHREIGYHSATDFLKAAFAARDKSKQEYVLLEQYRQGKLADAAVPPLIDLLERAGEKEAAREVGSKYIQEYILKLPEDLLYKKDNIDLMSDYVKSSKDELFTLFYKNSDKIDKATQKEYAEYYISNVITKEEVNSKLWSDKKRQHPITDHPDWAGLHAAIEKKYNKYYADEVMPDPKITWYKQHQQWKEYIDLEMEKVQKYFMDSAGNLKSNAYIGVNNVIYNYVFMYSDDKKILDKTMKWQKMIIDNDPDPDYLDTYANLLYKMGNIKEAIVLENKAMELDIAKAERSKGKPNPDFKTTLDKMKNNQPTWATK